jgi:hypothetical protein
MGLEQPRVGVVGDRVDPIPVVNPESDQATDLKHHESDQRPNDPSTATSGDRCARPRRDASDDHSSNDGDDIKEWDDEAIGGHTGTICHLFLTDKLSLT